MNTEELTQIVTAHQSAISRHDIEIAEIRQTLHRVGGRLDSVGERLDSIGARLDQVTEQQEANARQAALNHESIQILAASMQELRNLVADYLRGRAD